jgi:phosphatidylglycerophosphatase A
MSIHQRFALLISTFFGCGFLKPAPGTIGSLAALPFVWLLYTFGGFEIFILITIILFIVGIWAAGISRHSFNRDDPSEIVIDEVVGQWATLLVFVPSNAVHYFLGFVLFRIFDIFKPWPINWADKKIKGGLGIMLDDILAAVYAGGALYFIQNWL